MKKKLIALIPARKGSERVKDKNIQLINGKPLIFYSIRSAQKSKLFDRIIVSTDSKKYAKIAKKIGAEVPFIRPKAFSTKFSPDYYWVKHSIDNFKKRFNDNFDYFFILRPTNPFWYYKTIQRAWNLFSKKKKFDTLRSIEICKQHPGKMWLEKKDQISPLLDFKIKGQPSYNNQFQTLPKVYIQNGCIEISKVENIYKYKTITGKKILSFLTNSIESVDINYNSDLLKARDLGKKLNKFNEF